MKKGKIIILSAPSGTGKSTIIDRLRCKEDLELEFSISATSRKPRGPESDGKEYYFLTAQEFEDKIKNNEFVEWEEVYSGTKYGTLRKEVDRILGSGKNLIMDIDVKGALNVKKQYGNDAISIFILPPGLEQLEVRLRGRNTDSEESLRKRIEKAEHEMSFAEDFDKKIVNDILEKAVSDIETVIREFIKDTVQ